MIPPLHWNDHAFRVDLLDQTRLPVEEVWLEIETPAQMAEAIRLLRVRGAPAIGIAAAYGVVLSLRDDHQGDLHQTVIDTIEMLAQTRPTAVNLFYALNRMRQVAEEQHDASKEALQARLLEEAHAINREDQEAGLKLGQHGLTLLEDGMTVLTHCHAGGGGHLGLRHGAGSVPAG